MSLSKYLVISLATLCLLGFGQAASAQASRTWVSGVGDDANPCSRTAPCKTFAGAISKTAAGGIINCIDQGAYGAVTITKSMTIACEGVTAGVLHSSTNGIVVNANAADTVVLRGLFIDGSPPSSAGLNGVRFIAGAALLIENCQIRDSNGADPNGNGVLFSPAGSSRLQITDSYITGNGIGTTGVGVQIAPTGSGSADVVIRDTTLTANTIGIRADGRSTTGVLRVSVVDSVASNSSKSGIVAVGGTGQIRMLLDGVSATNNAEAGLRVLSANATVRIGRSTISNNTLGIETVSGGVVRSFGNNILIGNTNDGVVPPLDPQG